MSFTTLGGTSAVGLMSDEAKADALDHQALRFYADPAKLYEYPDLYRRIFGPDYRPELTVAPSSRFALSGP